MVKNIDSDLIRGNIDTIILKTMLDGDKYGLDIIKEVEARSNGTYELKQPTLYSCLKRLENQELISSYWLDSDIGGKRHYYKLTDKGRDFFRQKQEEWSKSKFIIDNLLSNFDDDQYRLVKKDDYDKIIEGKTFDYDEHKISEALKQYENSPTLASGEPEEKQVEPKLETSEDLSAEAIEDDDLGINEYNSLLGDEEDIDEDDIEEVDEEEYNSPVYLNSNTNNEEDNEEEETNTNLTVNDVLLSEHEKNLLSRLRFHDDDEVNTYYGDKNSYIKHLNLDNEENEDEDNEESENKAFGFNVYDNLNIEESENQEDDEIDEISEDSANEELEPEEETSNENEVYEENEEIEEPTINEDYIDEDNDLDNLVAVQQNLLDEGFNGNSDDFETKVNEFSEAARELQNFDSSGETTNKNEFDYTIPEPAEFVANEVADEEEFEEEVLEPKEFANIIENENFEEEITQEPEPSEEQSLSEESFEAANNSDEIINETNEQFTETNKLAILQDDFFDELDELKDNSRSSFIVSEDSTEYDSREVEKEIENFTQSEASNGEEDSYYQVEQNNDEVSDEFEFNGSDSITNEPDNYSDFSAFDNIISQNADTYSQATMFSENDNHQFFVPTIEERPAEPEPKPENDSIKKAKDINALKEEFELQGIKIKEFKKYNEHEEAAKNYLLVNKINLISSLILLFGYMFILSAVYIIMNNTSAALMTGFSFVYFAYGFIPFAAWAIYHIVKFMANPYKKVPAKYAPGVTIFIAIIITVQLLLITYCINLQLGFYSFTQASYNHLLWIIPTILSFAPIASNLIYIALFYSKNFNV